MEVTGMMNGSTWSSKAERRSKRGKLGCETEGVGDVSGASRELGVVEVGVSRENSERGDTVTSKKWGNNANDGKVIDQLANEVEAEINYYKSHVSKLESRLKELRELSGELNKISNSE